MDQSTAEHALRQLEPLVGEWTFEATWPNGESWPGGGRVTFGYFQLYSDECGVCRVYEMSIGDGEQKLWREGEPLPHRFTATFSDDGNTIIGRWEIAEDGTTYTTDFDLIYRRAET